MENFRLHATARVSPFTNVMGYVRDEMGAAAMATTRLVTGNLPWAEKRPRHPAVHPLLLFAASPTSINMDQVMVPEGDSVTSTNLLHFFYTGR